MANPFPGMNPWLEHPDGWRDVHTRLLTQASIELQPQLRSLGFYAAIEERIYVEESQRYVVPDVSVIESHRNLSGKHPATLVEVDEPILVHEIHEPVLPERVLQVYAAQGKQLVTQIEFISYSNKMFAQGRELYTRKRAELFNAGVNIVEIDLLRNGLPIVFLSETTLLSLQPWDYLVNLVRAGQADHEVYPILLENRLPRVRIPLRPESPDAVLNLQSTLAAVYESGPFPDRLDYESPPVPPLSAARESWSDAILRAAGLRKQAKKL